MKAPSCLALDLDGTLLTPSGSLPRLAAESIRRAQHSGVRVVLATSRDFALTQPLAAVLGVQDLICLSGAQCLRDGRFLFRNPLPAVAAQEIFTYALSLNLAAAWYVRKEVFLSPQWEAPDQLLLRGEPEALHRVYERFCALQGRLQFLFLPNLTTPEDLHVLHPRSTKGKALARLGRRLGLGASEILAAGNGLADIDMLEFAGCGVAVADAPPPVREAADLVLDEPLEEFLAEMFA